MNIPTADQPIISAAVSRVHESEPVADYVRGGVAMLESNGIDRIMVAAAIGMYADKDPLFEIINKGTVNTLSCVRSQDFNSRSAVFSFGLEALRIGWLIRDEQEKARHAIESPAVCDAGQTALRAAGHKFCPECGIIRALHRDLSDGDE